MEEKTIEELKKELNKKIEDMMKDIGPVYLDPTPNKEIQVEYKGYIGRYYVDYMQVAVDDEFEFHNIEIWKDGRMQLHGTLEGPLTEEQLLDRLKKFVDKGV